RVRVNLIDQTTGAYVNKAQVKVIGSQSGQFVSGETDLRGIFVADGIRGMAAAIARDENRRYAFHRGATFLARREEARGARKRRPQFQEQGGQTLWGRNLTESNVMLQRLNVEQLGAFYGQQRKGVQVQETR
ncbi:hypothetical protein HQ563_02520, partial [bacterium]|nr:hypothetical protein [bacterium]